MFSFKMLRIIGVSVLVAAGASFAMGSTIAGTVYDMHRNGLAMVDVELMNSYHSMIGHTMTDGVGRYQFEGLGDGDYYVRVLPFRYDFDEETQMVTITTISQNANRPGYTYQMLDFTLSPRKGTLAEAEAEVIVAQEIPPAAKKSYEAATGLVKKGKFNEAIPEFEKALAVFPEYFLANNGLATIYYDKKDYEHAAPLLMRAVQAYEKSGKTLYMLGVSLTNLHYYPAAIIALKQAAVLAPASGVVYLYLGSAQRMQRDYKNAETNLLEAKKLTKGNNVEVFRELTALYSETKQFEKAADSLEQMIKVGNFADADRAKMKEQIKHWRSLPKTN